MRPPDGYGAYEALRFAERGREPPAVDCWGLARLVLRDVHGVLLPSYAEDYETCRVADRARLEELFEAGQVAFEEVERPRPGDLVQLRHAVPHVGVVTHPPFMIHVQPGHDARHERYDLRWACRVEGFFRHPELARAA